MRTHGLLKLVVAACAAAIAVPALATQPALAAAGGGGPKPRLPMTVTSSVSGTTTETSATFSWNQVSGAAYTCSLDGATALTCSNAITYSGLSDGVHTFVLRGKLNAQYRPSTRSISWEVDSLPPGMPTVAPVPSPTSSTSANISFTNADPKAVAHTCSLDGAPEVSCTSPYAVSGLLDGTHTVAVRAVDANGNKSDPVQVTWVIDSTAPENVIVVGPPSPTNQTSAEVSFSAVGASSFTCSVDGGAALPCTSPYTVPGPLSEGQHTITVSASDAVGNVTPDSAVWAVDLTAPGQPTVITGPATTTNQTVADFILGNVDDSGALQCRLDDPSGSWAACPAPLHYSVAEGSHTLEVRSHDLAGNSSDVTTATWTVDTTAPAPAVFTDGPAAQSKDTTPGFAWLSTDGSTNGFECSLDGASYITCDSGFEWVMPDWPPLGEGSHVLSVRSFDLANNLSSPVTWSWRVDTTAPSAPQFSTTPDASTTDTAAVFSFASEPGTSFTCSLDGAAAVNCASPATFTGLAEGPHTFTVVAEDAAHNASQSTYDWTIVADSGPAPTPTPTPTPTQPTTPPAPPAAPAAGPTTSILTSSALKGTSTVTFSADVSGVSAATVKLADSKGTTVATSMVCHAASGAAVACSSSGVRSVALTPTTPLVPGETYTVSVAGGVKGANGVAASPTSRQFRASTTEQENSLRAGFTWAKAKAKAAYNHSYVVESHRKATFRYVFTGQRITWYTMTGPAQGVAKVFVDGARKGKVDNYSASTHWRVPRVLKGLGAGRHTLTIVVAGPKNARSSGTSVVVDAVRVGKTLVTSPAAATTWRSAKSTKASGHRYSLASTRGASTSFTFRGTAVSWSTRTARSMGKAKVYVDGVLKARVDNYSARSKWNVVRTVSGLSDATHTIKVVATGAKRHAASGTNVVVDRWTVR